MAPCGAVSVDAFASPQVGDTMSEFPLDPQLAKMMVAAPEFKCAQGQGVAGGAGAGLAGQGWV